MTILTEPANCNR